jgi:hypothetical protein
MHAKNKEKFSGNTKMRVTSRNEDVLCSTNSTTRPLNRKQIKLTQQPARIHANTASQRKESPAVEDEDAPPPPPPPPSALRPLIPAAARMGR